MAKAPKLWKRAERLVKRCEAGKTVCRFNRAKETGENEVVYFLEPDGRQVGRRTVENAITHGLLVPRGDGLLGEDFSQTYGVRA